MLFLLFPIVSHTCAQSVDHFLALAEKKQCAEAINGLHHHLQSLSSENTVQYKIRYYLGKCIYDMLRNGNTLNFNYSDALNQWLIILKQDKSRTWLPHIEKDIVHLTTQACIGHDKRINTQQEVNIYKELLDHYPNNPVFLFGMGEAYDHANHHLLAYNYYTQAIKSYMEKRDPRYTESAVSSNLRIAEHKMFKSNTYNEALSYARYGLALDPDHLELQIIEALALYKSGNEETGLKKFENILNRHPQNSYVREKYAYLLEHIDAEKAAEQYKQILQSTPNHSRALLYLGKYYTDKATDIFQSAAHMHEVQRLMLEGIGYLEKYRQWYPDDKEIIHSLIRFYDNLRMYEKADALRKELGQ